MSLKLLAAVALVIIGSAASNTVATASDTDWKPYGSTGKNGDTELCFFDLSNCFRRSGRDFDQATNFSAFEEIADIASIEPSARICYEIDCAKIMLRELSVQIVNVGWKSASTHGVSEWHYLAPETNGARLQKILREKSVAR